MLRGTIAAGRDFVPQAGFFTTDDPDVYVIATLGGATATTPTVNNNVAPVWGTPFTFLVHNVRQALALAAWEDDTAGDDALGVGAISAADLTAAGDAWLPIAPAPAADGAAAAPAGDVQLTGRLHALDVLDGGSEGVGGLKLPLSSVVAAPGRVVVMDKGLLEGGSCTGSVRVKFFLYGIGA